MSAGTKLDTVDKRVDEALSQLEQAIHAVQVVENDLQQEHLGTPYVRSAGVLHCALTVLTRVYDLIYPGGPEKAAEDKREGERIAAEMAA